MTERDAPEEPKEPGLRERIEQIVADLAKRGEIRAKDIQKAAKDMAERSARDRRELLALIQKEIRRQVGTDKKSSDTPDD